MYLLNIVNWTFLGSKYLCEAHDSELTTARSRMAQVPPSFNEGSRTCSESIPLKLPCYVPVKGEKFKPFPHCKYRFVKMIKWFCHMRFITGTKIFLFILQHFFVSFTNFSLNSHKQVKINTKFLWKWQKIIVLYEIHHWNTFFC